MKQIAYIRQHYARRSAAHLAQKLGRDESSIKNCIKRYGIHKQPHTRVVMHLDTMVVYPSTVALARAYGFSERKLRTLQPGEIRQTPAGAVRLASKQEVEQWKQASGK